MSKSQFVFIIPNPGQLVSVYNKIIFLEKRKLSLSVRKEDELFEVKLF